MQLHLSAQPTNFLQSNYLIVRQSDQNAGLVIINKIDNDIEIQAAN